MINYELFPLCGQDGAGLIHLRLQHLTRFILLERHRDRHPLCVERRALIRRKLEVTLPG